MFNSQYSPNLLKLKFFFVIVIQNTSGLHEKNYVDFFSKSMFIIFKLKNNNVENVKRIKGTTIQMGKLT